MAEALIVNIRANISAFERALDLGRRAARQFGQRVRQEFQNAERAGDRLDDRVEKLGNSFRSLGTVVATVGLGVFARQGFQLADQFTSINRTLVATTGGAQQAGEALQFVRDTSQRLGTDVISGARAFAQLTNAAQGTALEGQGVRDIFTSISESTLALGLNTDQYGRALLAVTQILNRGRVQTEELNQLTEAGIPIYKDLAAAIGITGEQLQNALQRGQVPAEALLLVADQLGQKFSETARIASNTTAVAFGDLRNATAEATGEFFAAILSSQELRDLLRNLADSAREFTDSIDVPRISAFVDVLARLAGLALQNVTNKINDLIDAFNLAKSVVDDVVSVFQRAPVDIGEDLADLEEGFDGITEQAGLSERALDDFGNQLQRLNRIKNEIIRGTTGETAAEARRSLQELEDFEINTLRAIQEAEFQADADREANRIRIIENETRIQFEAIESARRARIESAISVNEQELRNAEELERFRERTLGAIDRANQQRIQAELTQARRPIEQALNNIQSSVAGFLGDALRGELDDVRDVMQQFADIVLGTFAEIAAARIINPAFENLLERAGVLRTANGAPPAAGGLTAGGAFGAGAAGLGVGFASSGILSQAGVGGTAGGVLSGALGGATTGALVGSVLPGIGTAIGAGVGAAVGALAGGLISAFGGGGPGEQRIGLLTTAQRPRVRPSDDAFVQGAFGVVSLVNEQSSRTNAQAISGAIAELDRSIFNLLNERQRQIVTARLQRPAGNLILGQGSSDTDDALQQVITQRLQQIIQAVGGQRVAQRVIGQGINADVATLERRVTDALNILTLIEEFRAGPTTEAASAIKAVNDEFANLISRAQEFGIATTQIAAEQARRIAEVANVVNRDVQQRILEITDPGAGQQAALAERQRRELQNARDANANIEQVERLHVLERQQLARQLQSANTEVEQQTRTLFDRAQDIISQTLTQGQRINLAFRSFLERPQNLSQAGQELQSIREEFDRLRAAANVLGRGIRDITNTFNFLQRRARDEARVGATIAIQQLIDPFAAALFSANQQIEEFRRLARDGLIPQRLFDQLERVSQTTTRVNESLRRASGGATSPIQQLADSFESFIRAGNPLSAAGQELFNLTETFLNLKDAADFLGLSTRQLERSFESQARTLRERVIEDIDRQFDPQRERLGAIGDFIASSQTATTQPLGARLTAAQTQFESALEGGELNQILQSAGQLRDIANQAFGTTADFFGIQNQIENSLVAFREQEQSRIDTERQRLIDQADRERQQIVTAQDSLSVLRLVNNSSGDTAEGLRQLVNIARQQTARMDETQDLLERLLARSV